jgi:2-aminoadipate transaminase
MAALPDSQLPQIQLAPDMIHLGLGQPSASLLPIREMETAAGICLGNDEVFFLAYGEARGNSTFRQTLADFLIDQYQKPMEPDQLLITSGISQALDFICTLFARPGDTIFVEEPSYFLALKIFGDHHLNLVSIPVDENGLDTKVLEEKLASMSPAFLYIIPTYQNPSSVTLSPERREALARISAQKKLLVVADEVYHFLNYKEKPPLPLRMFGDQFMSLGSFSKILAPGLRLGWIHTSQDLVKKISRAGLMQSGGGFNPFTSEIVNFVIQKGFLLSHIKHLRQTYSHRAEVLCRELRAALPETISFQTPLGGYFVWLKFPDGINTQTFRKTAQKQNVDFFPGSVFCSGAGFPPI